MHKFTSIAFYRLLGKRDGISFKVCMSLISSSKFHNCICFFVFQNFKICSSKLTRTMEGEKEIQERDGYSRETNSLIGCCFESTYTHKHIYASHLVLKERQIY